MPEEPGQYEGLEGLHPRQQKLQLGLVSQGEGGTVVRIFRRQVNRPCPVSYTKNSKSQVNLNPFRSLYLDWTS